MATPPNPAQGPSPEQMAMMQKQLAAEAQKRGMTPQQFQAMQRKQLEDDAKKAGLTFDQYINRLKQQAFENHQRQQQMMAQQQQAAAQAPPGQPQTQGQGGQQVPITPNAPDPKALAVAKWLRGQDLKPRTCILNGQRKDLFRVKRALRAIQSPAYVTAQKKNQLLPPPPTTPYAACELFKLLPLSLLALRVSKVDPHEGHNHGKQKRIKGLWTVKIEQQQDINEDLHYVWLYEGSQWKTKLYAVGALILIMAVVMFPLWPIKLRIGVWYLSMGFLGLIGLFILMSIFRLILFGVTVVTMPKGLWLYPNLFEDVGFFDSFRPVWGWQEDKPKKGSKKIKAESEKDKSKSKSKSRTKTNTTSNGSATTTSATTTATPSSAPETANTGVTKRIPSAHAAPRVEEVEDE